MNYKEAVQKKIAGEVKELDKRVKLWEEIASAYEEGGENAIKAILTGYAENITGQFNKLLEQLRGKL